MADSPDPIGGPSEQSSSDEDILGRVNAALWAVPAFRGRVAAEVSRGAVTLTGTLDNEAERTQASETVRRLAGIAMLQNLIHISGTPHRATDIASEAAAGMTGSHAAGPSASELNAKPMIFVTRHCSLHASSLSAAVEQAVFELERFARERQVERTGALFMILRNLHGETVTADIGWPVSALHAERALGEVKAGTTPSGPMLKTELGDGPGPLLQLLGQVGGPEGTPDHAPAVLFCQIGEVQAHGHLCGLTLFMSPPRSQPPHGT